MGAATTTTTILLALSGCVSAFPSTTDRNNTGVEPAWVSDPVGRGTFGLLLSCVLTLGLCVWTAVHLNIEPAPKGREILRRKVLWVFIGLFAPEIVMVSSYKQWWKARSLFARLQQFERNPSQCELAMAQERGCHDVEPDTWGSFVSQWRRLRGRYRKIQQEVNSDSVFGMECSFFIAMGGTTIARSGSSPARITLTPEGFEYLLATNFLQPSCLEKAAIMDKGKADFIAKFLVCVQAAWMVMQCILRKLSNLPITLIELNTMLHVVCAIVMYFFWWDKPLNVAEPISVCGDQDLADVLFALDMRRTQDVSVSMAIATNETPLFERAALKRDAPTIYKALFPTLELPFGGFNIRGQVPEDWKAKGNRKWALWDLAKSAQRISPKDKDLASIFPPTVSIHEKNFSLRGEKEIEATGDGKNLYGSVITALTHPVTLTSSEIQTLFSAARALDKEDFRAIKEDYENYEMNQGHLYGTKGEDAMEFITPRVKNLHFDMDIVLSEIHEFNDPHILLSLLNILYGGAHASAWNGHFPTSIERWIWRVSCLVLVLPAIATTTKYITQKLPSKAHMDYYVDRAVHILLHPLLLVYFLARVYIVVESFISVRSLPEGSYQTVEMSAFWPHF